MAGLYIHIPFCGQRCAYCDFYKSTDTAGIAGFLEALEREMAARRSRNADGDFFVASKLDTIYIGGGTPSLLSPGQLQALLDRAAELWDCTNLKEITLEANPEDLSGEFLRQLRITNYELRDSIKFNRLSIGVQSFDDALLRLMNRRHDAARAKNAVRAAQRAGFDNITIDLIYGIPGMSPAQWERTLDEAIALGVQHISAYHLTIEPGTAFAKNYKLRITNYEKAEEESERQFIMLREKLGRAGFEHYEISNFALPGRRAVHNSAYWSGKPYLGIGPSAHSFDGERRREWVVSDIEKYARGAGTNNIYDGETLTDGELFNERVMTALRTSEGLDLAAAESGFGTERIARLEQNAEKFLSDGSLLKRDGRLVIPPEKFLLSDYIIASLFEEEN